MLRKSQSGMGLISLILVLAITGLIGWYMFDRLTAGGNPEEASSEAINKAVDSVDKANDAKKKTNTLIDEANETVDGINP